MHLGDISNAHSYPKKEIANRKKERFERGINVSYQKTSKKWDLEKQIESLQRKNKKLRGYQGLVKEFGDNPDEIKLKLNQIYDWNDKK